MNYLFVTSMVGYSTIYEVRTCSTVLLVLLQCFLEFPGVLCLNATPFSDYSVSGRHRSPPRYQLIIIINNNGIGKSAPVRRCGAYLPQLCGEMPSFPSFCKHTYNYTGVHSAAQRTTEGKLELSIVLSSLLTSTR